ncbi:MAG: PD-(D/E)XK nuclease family protein [Spirosomataceae bacterium]
MIWSISSYKTFKRCPRQWYYKNIVADGKVKNDAFRVEITRLSRLKTIDAWRGEIVDQIISDDLIRQIRFKNRISIDGTIQLARRIFDKQFEMETAPLSEINKHQFGFIDIEFGREISKEKLERAWADIELALNNFINNTDLITELYDAESLLPQRTLTLTYEGIGVRAVPDLISFFKNKSPKIYDWKVHFEGTNPNEEQLILYALALKNCNPQKGFPEYLTEYDVSEIRLAEVQLIANQSGFTRNYQATDNKIIEMNELLDFSRLQMYGMYQLKKYNETSAGEFVTTADPDNCINCGFQKHCKQVKL